MFLALRVIIICIALPIVLFLAFGIWRTWATGHGAYYERFMRGMSPSEMPDGPYDGTVAEGPTGGWRGKIFDAAAASGQNMIVTGGVPGLRYPFRMRIEPGLREPGRTVLVLDYDLPENPLWLRLVRDELVAESDGGFFGKVHILGIPKLPFTITYFSLIPQKPTE